MTSRPTAWSQPGTAVCWALFRARTRRRRSPTRGCKPQADGLAPEVATAPQRAGIAARRARPANHRPEIHQGLVDHVTLALRNHRGGERPQLVVPRPRAGREAEVT